MTTRTRSIGYKRWGLTEDPRGLHVTLEWQGRTLLGAVTDCEFRQFGASGFILTVHHFNGEPWPLQPSAMTVRVLNRDWTPEGSVTPC